MDDPKIVSLKLTEIILALGTQVRAKIDEGTVENYTDEMKEPNAKFPPVVIYHDGAKYILADGFHRLLAARKNGYSEVMAEVRKGTKTDALKFALSANATHGLRRTNADKRRSVELALSEWPNLSSAEISRICAVSHTFVDEVRRQVQPATDAACRIGADGKSRRFPGHQFNTVQPGARARNDSEPSKQTGLQAAFDKEANPAMPTPPVQKEEFDHVVGISPAENFFASQVEDIAQAICDDASDIQMDRAIQQWEIELRRLRAEQKQREDG